MFQFSRILVPKPIYVHLFRSMMHKVFVYGTLKRNEPNYHWLTDSKNGQSKFIAEGTTIRKYPLIIATKYNIPFLLYSPGNGNRIEGEVFEVDDKMLSNLDILEDHPNYYVREIDEIYTLNPTTNLQENLHCWVYFLKKYKSELLKRAMLKNYSSAGPHGKPYMDRSKRDPQYNYKTEIKGDRDSN